MQYTPVSLGDNAVFDGYNNYWPAISLFGAIFSLITGLLVVDAMAISIPLVAALTIPLFYVLVRRITKNTKIALIATALLATAYPYTLFTAGVTKETFANPIYVCVLLIFLLVPSWKRTLLFSLSSVVLVLSHHLATLVTIGVLITLTIGLLYSKDSKTRYSVKSNVGLLGILSGVAVAYFYFYSYSAFPASLSSSDLLTVGAHQLVVLAVILFFTSKAGFPSRKQLLFCSSLIIMLSCFFVVLLTQRPLVSSAPILPIHYVIYMVPFMVLLPVMMFAFDGLYERRSRLLLPLFWLSPIIALEGYAIFSGSPIGLTLTSRTLNFLILPLLILVGLAFYKCYTYSKNARGRRIIILGMVASLLVVALVNCYSLFASVSLKERYMGYFWLYRAPESVASALIYATTVNQTVAGDVKVFYLLRGYFGVKVDVYGGLNYLAGDGSVPGLLFVYPEMVTNGYVIYNGNVWVLQENWTSKVVYLNAVYSNGMVNLYAK